MIALYLIIGVVGGICLIDTCKNGLENSRTDLDVKILSKRNKIIHSLEDKA